MKLVKFTIITIIIFFALFVHTDTDAQGIYTIYDNSNWSEICSYPGDQELDYPYDGQPLVSGFWPDGDFERVGIRAFETTSPSEASENPFHREFSVPGSLPSELGGFYSSSSGQCIWEAYSNTYVSGGERMAYTPSQDFSGHNVTRAQVGFLYWLNDPVGISDRNYNIQVDWEKTSPPGEGIVDTTYVDGDIGGGSWATYQTGYVLRDIGVREGYKISSIRIMFPQPDSIQYFLFPSILKLDRITIRGYQINLGPTPTPTPTRTPTVGPTPTQTTTPRAIWNTPTPGTPLPTKQFPPHYGSIPTRIPPLSFPDWSWLSIPTPSSYFTIPLIDTPVMPTRAPFTFTIPISYSTPASFFPPTVTATPTVSGTVTATITPTETITPTATATRADIVAAMNLAATNLYSEAAVMSNPTTFTIQSAPVDYAPSLPRPMADIGYTFENMQDGIGFLYGPRSWAVLLGYMIAMPFQLVKFFYTMAQMMGPVGLFLTWLLILLPFVLFSRLFIFIKNTIISIINLVIKIIQFIGDIWDLFPFA
jgi:hypothetical protein